MLNKKDWLYFLTFGVVCLAVFVFGIVFVLSSDIKGVQNDAIRVSDFGNIKYNSETYLSQNKRLPKSLKELDDSGIGTRISYGSTASNKSLYKDPKTKEYYDYKPANDNTSFEICTTFEAGSDKIQQSTYSYSYQTKIAFKKGYDCVKFPVDSYYIKGGID